MKTDPYKCPQCGAALSSGAPQGLCPKCLLAAVASQSEPTSRPAPAPGTLAAVFPGLELLELIGQGGMGWVYKAKQTKLDRVVALKVLSPTLAANPAFAERFAREARMLARLSHANIVAVYDFGQADGYCYLIMEYVDGVNLRQAMGTGRFSAEQALALVPHICEALQYAHGEGVLHRDIKPENILLDAKGRVKIADFGIAKLVGELGVALTGTGAALGTPHYMAPEQLERPAEVDHRADIYSLGVVFYEMLTGELPLGRFAPPSQKSTVDPRVDEVVLRTLEKERERRFQSAGEIKTRVENIAATPPSLQQAPPPLAGRPRRDRRGLGSIILWVAAGMIALLILPALGLIAWSISYRRSQAPAASSSMAILRPYPNDAEAEANRGWRFSGQLVAPGRRVVLITARIASNGVAVAESEVSGFLTTSRDPSRSEHLFAWAVLRGPDRERGPWNITIGAPPHPMLYPPPVHLGEAEWTALAVNSSLVIPEGGTMVIPILRGTSDQKAKLEVQMALTLFQPPPELVARLPYEATAGTGTNWTSVLATVRPLLEVE